MLCMYGSWACRMGRGGRYRAASLPAQPLIVWGYEPSPFVRLVKEVLCELELPHYFKACARGSPNRQKMFDTYGKFQVPLLEDPNTGLAMFESAEIVKYLEETYATSDVARPANV
jgi:glutathione S-transferase